MSKKMNPLFVLAALLFTVTLLVPSILVLPFMEEKASGKLGEEIKPASPASKPADAGPSADSAVEVAVYRTAQSKLEKLPLDQYLVGVVAAEMPADFELEALKAQALTARTYYVKQISGAEKTKLPQGAQVLDTDAYQVFLNNQELKKQWGADYNWKVKKITEAVKATDGQILTYDGAPIEATFFSTSNGYTENSEDYWPNSFPYLRSVESPWDLQSPKYTNQTVMSVAEFQNKLGVKLSGESEPGKIIERTDGNRVGKIQIGGKTLTGKEVRDALGLKSSDFTWILKGNNIVINTKGFGHGVGMSQYGANGMAAEGKTYKEIVQHYYKGVEIASAENTLTKVTAKK
ncbi:stage II sporulation protein D [Mesobacillus foraminis]|uniref:Stage II sporulation protein D n=1 Tax=Mesobacillus foraminis TaxID=279826 RepID=A0A4R2BCX0_9BACI|nr:stage II sporulation protein D [Mesobacillus foraminis]TCN24082.1 stage II sporulation protein D [Mesobacillus foraminis]